MTHDHIDTAKRDLNKGLAYRAQNKLPEAEACFRSVLLRDPANTEVLFFLAAVCLETKRPREALPLLEKCVAAKPRHAPFWDALSVAFRKCGLFERSRDASLKATTLAPANAFFWHNLGSACKHARLLSEAEAAFQQALKIHPYHADAENNLGAVLAMQLRFREAIPHYRRALELSPKDHRFHFNEGIARLTLGEYRLGFLKYEFRWNTLIGLPQFEQPLWRGDFSLAGKTVLLHAEQGSGDTLQFCRYAPLVAEQGARVILEVQPSLAKLCEVSFPGIQVIAHGTPLPQFDAHCPLMTLPHAFRTELKNIPSPQPYLSVPASSRRHWSERLGPRTRPRIAFVWAGSSSHQEDSFRSVPLESLLPLLSRPDIQAVSLQKERDEGQARALGAIPGLIDLSPEIHDFCDAAAVLLESDLLIAVDTAVAHLGGALGVPTWILNRFNTDWRWLLDRHDSPWYPSAVRLFRQTAFGDWSGPLARLETELAAFLATRTAPSEGTAQPDTATGRLFSTA